MIDARSAHSALDPASPGAASVHRLFIFFLVVSVLIWIAVMAAAIWAVRRHRSVDETWPAPERDARAHRVIGAAAGVTILILFASLLYDLSLGHGSRRSSNQMLSIRVIGHQWWWEVEYEDPVAGNRVHTANEVHVPVGRPVALKLEAADVIHSFWAPNLGGKKDLIPGHHNEMWFTASRPGVFRAPCAEFCGLEHAKMALYVVAEDEPAFRAWLDHERTPSPAPSDTLAVRGREVFESGSCVMCHTVAGTSAHATIGPDLSHVASRTTIAAGTLANTRGNLAGWIMDPQRIKPGVLMPSNSLEPPDLQALLAYLGTLR
jgi:cytochrome c oxidase subunit II